MATEKVFEIHANVTIHLTQQDIDDIMVLALEGGITYWCDNCEVNGSYLGEYASDQISRGGSLKLHIIEPFDEQNAQWYELDLKKFVDGFRRWVENGDDEYGVVSATGVDCGMMDSVCADEIIQYALFGEIVFG